MAAIDSYPLRTTLLQTNTSPATLALSVTNTASQPLTVLKWNSPLDSLALQLGLLSITPAGASLPLDLPTIQVKRRVPPSADQFVTIPSGEAAIQEVVLKGPFVSTVELRGSDNGKNEDGSAPAKTKVVCQGMWMAVWAGEKEEIGQEKLEDLVGDEEYSQKLFESNVLEITVD